MTRPLFALAIIVALTQGARSFLEGRAPVTGSGAALAFGFLLLSTLQAGRIFATLKLPRLTGYLLCGLLFGPEGVGLLNEAMLKDLALVKRVAVGLVALLAGCELNFVRLRPRLRAIGIVGAGALTTSAVALGLVFFGLTFTIPGAAGLPFAHRALVALLAANTMVALSPPMVMGVVAELRAAGPLSELVVAMAILADIAVVLTFSVSTSFANGVFLPGGAAASGHGPILHILFSLALGAAAGAVLGVYNRRIGRRVGLFTFGLFFLLAETGRVLEIDPLLCGLAAGLAVENWSPGSGEQLTHAVEPATLPTFAVYFGVLGADVPLRTFLQGMGFAALVSGVRIGGLWLGTRFMARRAGLSSLDASRLVTGMMPQAGVALSLANLLLAYPHWGKDVAALLLGGMVVSALVGPVLFRAALVNAGEAGRRGEQPHGPTPALPASEASGA